MKNKVKLIDINILSSYMGRSLTWLVTVIVLGLTLSALFGGGGLLDHGATRVFVSFDVDECLGTRDWEPFRRLLARVTKRPVVLKVSSEIPDDFDVFIGSTADFLEMRGKTELRAIATFKLSPVREKVVILAAAGAGPVDFSKLGPDQILFGRPSSVNSFLLPLEILKKGGFMAPADSGKFHFARTSCGGTERTVFAVLFGRYRVGACTMSSLRRLVDGGQVRADEVSIVAESDALPEVVIAVSSGDGDYYSKALRDVDAFFGESDRGRFTDTVELLKANGIHGSRGLSPGELEKAEELIRAGERRAFP